MLVEAAVVCIRGGTIMKRSTLLPSAVVRAAAQPYSKLTISQSMTCPFGHNPTNS